MQTGDLLIASAISGIAGAKLFAIIDPEGWGKFTCDPLGYIFSGGGLSIYGGLIGGFIFVYFYAKRKGFKPIHVMDAAAPALIAASATFDLEVSTEIYI